MANLKAGTLLGGNMIWHAGNMPLIYANGLLTVDGKLVYTEFNKPTPAAIGAVNKAGDTMTAALRVTGVTAGNGLPSADQVKLDGYGLIGNRGAVYISNGSADINSNVQIGVGGVHGSTVGRLTVKRTQIESNVPLYEGSNRVYSPANKPTATDVGALPNTGGIVTGSFQATAIGVTNTSNSSGNGLSLYSSYTSGMPSYGLAFSGTATFGKHGAVQGDWATYLTMTGANNRGWIFKSGNTAGGNVASISSGGAATFDGDVKSGGSFLVNAAKGFGYSTGYVYTPYTTVAAGGIGTRSEMLSSANILLHADVDGSGTVEGLWLRAGAGTANELRILSKTSSAGQDNTALKFNGNTVYHAGYKPTPTDVEARPFKLIGSITLQGNAPTAGGNNMFTVTIPSSGSASSQLCFNLELYAGWSHTNVSGSERYQITYLASGASPALQAAKIVPISNSTFGKYFTFSTLRRDANGIHFDIHYSGNNNVIYVYKSLIYHNASGYGTISIGNARVGTAGTRYDVYNTLNPPTAADVGVYTKSEIDTKLNTKLNLSGGTLTGALGMNANLEMGDGKWIYFHKSGTDSLRMNHSTSSSDPSFDFYNQTKSKFATIRAGNVLDNGSRVYSDNNPPTPTNVGLSYLSQSSSEGLVITLNGKRTVIGNRNTSWSHFDTDATDGFYFYKNVNAQNLASRGTVSGVTANATGTASGQGLAFNGKTAIGGVNDAWLRLNPHNQFGSGIYCGSTGVLRHDTYIMLSDYAPANRSVRLAKGAGGTWNTDKVAYIDLGGAPTSGSSATHLLRLKNTAGTTIFTLETLDQSGQTYLRAGAGNFRFDTDGVLNITKAPNISVAGACLTNSALTSTSKQLIFATGATVYFGNPNLDEAYLETKTGGKARVNIGGSKYDIYHVGNKPSAADIGAMASDSGYLPGNYGTVAYGRNGFQTSNVSGTGGTGLSGSQVGNPTSDWYYHMTSNHSNSGGYYFDMAACFHTDGVYGRRLVNGALQPWFQFYTTSNKPSAADVGTYTKSEIDTKDNAKLNLSGGTMTGALTVNNTITSNNRVTATQFKVAANAGYFAGDANYTTFTGSNFYIQSGTPTTYIYSPNIYLGNTTGTTVHYRGNALSGNSWNMSTGGALTCASVTASGNVTAYSDRRVKTDIKNIPDALTKVQKINGVTYKRTDTEDKEKLHTGLIAQELEAVLPEAVITSENGDIKDFKSVAYGNVVGLLVEAIKELNAKIEKLENQLNK